MGMDIDVRTAAFIASGDTTLHFPGLSGPNLQQSSRAQRFAMMLGTLWPRGVNARASALRAQNRFQRLSGTDRLLLAPLTETEAAIVDVQDPDWERIVAERLTTGGAVRLTNSIGETTALAAALVELQTAPLDVGWILAYPRVVGTGRRSDVAYVDLELSESPQ
ncbi:hypothetical protein ASD90_01435 [Terrabacter sp. Root181]|nr:hypothetical protein ASD90_01435 [Terrabacter sp. Root181]